MIQFASNAMIDELKALWLEGFEGDDEYCSFFFKNYFSCENCVVHTNDRGEVESAVHIFRGKVNISGKEHTVVFLYAVATFRKYRKMGKFSAICSFLADYCRENGIGIIALSTTPPSRSPCEKLGMRPGINMGAVSMMLNRVVNAYSCEKCGYGEFAAMRNAFVGRDFEIYWPDETLKYMYSEMQTSGDIVKIVMNDHTYYAAYTRLEDELLIRETNCPSDDMSAMVDSVCAHIHYQGKITIYTKAGTVLSIENAISQEVFCYAHMWFIDETLDIPNADWYINLTAE